jgi:uncharacterized phiE125 gp8 family phage protein
MKTPKILVPPAGPLFTIEEVRAQCRITATDVDSDGNLTHLDDDLVLGFLESATEMAEDFTGLSIAVRTYEIGLDSFDHQHYYGDEFLFGVPESFGTYYGPWGSRFRRPRDRHIEIPVTPLIEVESFIYGEGSDAVTLEENVDFIVDDYRLFARLLPPTIYATWPIVQRATNLIKIQVRAGFQLDTDGNSGVPKAIRQAIMLAVADWYSNREDSNEKQNYALPNGSQALLRPKRVRIGAA